MMNVASSPPINIPGSAEKGSQPTSTSISNLTRALGCWLPGDPVEQDLFPVLTNSFLSANCTTTDNSYIFRFKLCFLRPYFYRPSSGRNRIQVSDNELFSESESESESDCTTTEVTSQVAEIPQSLAMQIRLYDTDSTKHEKQARHSETGLDPHLDFFPDITTMVSPKQMISYADALDWISQTLNEYQRTYDNPWFYLQQKSPPAHLRVRAFSKSSYCYWIFTV